MIRDSNNSKTHNQTTTNQKLIHTNKIAQKQTTLTSNHIPSSHMYL